MPKLTRTEPKRAPELFWASTAYSIASSLTTPAATRISPRRRGRARYRAPGASVEGDDAVRGASFMDVEQRVKGFYFIPESVAAGLGCSGMSSLEGGEVR